MNAEAEKIIRLGGILAFGNGGGLENPWIVWLIVVISFGAYLVTY